MAQNTRIYLIRHCEAQGNKNRVFHGHYDSEITENGMCQLKLLSERFKDIPYDVIYSSDLQRAYKTAEAANKYRMLPIIKRKELREIFGGEWEDLDFVNIAKKFPAEFEMWTNDPKSFKMPGGESYFDFYNRIKAAMDTIIKENKGKTAVVVTHGTVIKLYLTYASGLKLEDSEKIEWCDNTAVSVIDYDDNFVPEIEFMNDNSHLTEETMTIHTQEWYREYKMKGKV